LGGEENVPEDIKDVRIKFGEVFDDRSGLPTGVAGFGIHDEVLPLVKGKTYRGSE
tara:strand:+ start:998 stop:1162 length:165 start_codon:yes stop_codon:yes gene_type:complete